MDFFGIGQALSGTSRTYFMGARKTGRTVSLVEAVKDGDRVVFTNQREADRVKRLAKDRDVTISTIVMKPIHPEEIFEHGPSEGRTIFDHSWVESYYLNTHEEAQQRLWRAEKNTSGKTEAHRETRRTAEEIRKYQVDF